jgi:hypothetical protein
MAQKNIAQRSTELRQKWRGRLGFIVAWTWTVLAGGGGVMLLIEKGPWPLTNGWFVLCSGVAACPLTTWLANRFLGISLSGRVRFATAALIWLAGQIARRVRG